MSRSGLGWRFDFVRHANCAQRERSGEVAHAPRTERAEVNHAA